MKNHNKTRRKNFFISRREFLKISGAAALMSVPVLANTDFAMGTAESGEKASKHLWGMLIDLNNCVGCDFCTSACREINNLPDDICWNIVTRELTSTRKIYFLPRPCLHCDNPPCTDVCPVRATYKRPDGIVVTRYDICIGCRYCQVTCPYGARSFNWKKPVKTLKTNIWGGAEIEPRPRGVIEKCTFCQHRIDKALETGLTPGKDREVTPACVNACPANARFFGDLNDPASMISKTIKTRRTVKLRESLGTNSKVYYIPKNE
jgi:Fe-S-cluster-containing dehydrogenase component